MIGKPIGADDNIAYIGTATASRPKRVLFRHIRSDKRLRLFCIGSLAWLVVSGPLLFQRIEDINLLLLIPITTVVLSARGAFNPRDGVGAVLALHVLNLPLVVVRMELRHEELPRTWSYRPVRIHSWV